MTQIPSIESMYHLAPVKVQETDRHEASYLHVTQPEPIALEKLQDRGELSTWSLSYVRTNAAGFERVSAEDTLQQLATLLHTFNAGLRAFGRR